MLLPTKKCGHTLLLDNDLDEKLQLYLKQIRANGGPLTGRIAIAAARGLLLADNPSKFVENDGHIKLNRHWAYIFTLQKNGVYSTKANHF